MRGCSARPSRPGSLPTASCSGSGRFAAGGTPSASAVADAATRPPPASTSSKRARSPTRCGGGSSPEPQRTPRPGKRDVLGADEPTGRVGEVARVDVFGQEPDPRAKCSCSVASRSGSTGSETRARAEQGNRVRLQALQREQLPDERVEYRTVHDERPERRFRLAHRNERPVGGGAARGCFIRHAGLRTAIMAPVSERNPEPMTKAQRDALAAELAELEGPRQAEVVEAIATARGYGDLSGELRLPRCEERAGPARRRIAILRDRVENAVIVEQAADGVVGVGSVVEVEDEVAAASRSRSRASRAVSPATLHSGPR